MPKTRKSLLRRLEDKEKKYKNIIGFRVDNFEGKSWIVVGTNDLGHPYFSKIINGKIQKAQFTLSGYYNYWVKEKLAGGYNAKEKKNEDKKVKIRRLKFPKEL